MENTTQKKSIIKVKSKQLTEERVREIAREEAQKIFMPVVDAHLKVLCTTTRERLGHHSL